jgi:hypothetical protein
MEVIDFFHALELSAECQAQDILALTCCYRSKKVNDGDKEG